MQSINLFRPNRPDPSKAIYVWVGHGKLKPRWQTRQWQASWYPSLVCLSTGPSNPAQAIKACCFDSWTGSFVTKDRVSGHSTSLVGGDRLGLVLGPDKQRGPNGVQGSELEDSDLVMKLDEAVDKLIRGSP